jgi:hypothetical protein
MSGAVINLITNDGKGDRMILATKLLNDRIEDIMCTRRNNNLENITPTLTDLEQTHILFFNAHFKPFAAVASEYNKVKPQSGSISLGGSVQFSIPQFGDFFYDMVCRQVLSNFSSSLQIAPTQSVPGFPANGLDWNNVDTAVNTTYSLVDPFGYTINPGTQYRNLVRYCEYPGERLFQKVSFEVNANNLDEYYDYTTFMLRKFRIPIDKITGYRKLVGQETEQLGVSGVKRGYVYDANNDGAQPYTTLDGNLVPTIPQQSVEPVSTAPVNYIQQNFPDNAWNWNPAVPIIHDPSSGSAALGYANVMRETKTFVDGPQTPKYEQPSLEIWNKLNFWFNHDVHLAVPSVAIPYGQRFIQIELARQELLAFEYPGVYVKQVLDQVIPGVADVADRTINYRPFYSPGTISNIEIKNIELYVNNLFVNPEIHDIYIKRIAFSLIRVFRHHTTNISAEGERSELLNQLKWPIEYMMVGFQPIWNINARNPNQWRDWHRVSKTFDIIADKYDYCELPNGVGGPTFFICRAGQIVPDSYVKECKTVDNITVTAFGIDIFKNFPTPFFTQYAPTHYGGAQVHAADDEGALFINFALYPGSYQPSGHINLSRAREFYLNFNSSYMNPTNPIKLIVVASAINFLLITEGSATLRFST